MNLTKLQLQFYHHTTLTLHAKFDETRVYYAEQLLLVENNSTIKAASRCEAVFCHGSLWSKTW